MGDAYLFTGLNIYKSTLPAGARAPFIYTANKQQKK